MRWDPVRVRGGGGDRRLTHGERQIAAKARFDGAVDRRRTGAFAMSCGGSPARAKRCRQPEDARVARAQRQAGAAHGAGPGGGILPRWRELSLCPWTRLANLVAVNARSATYRGRPCMPDREISSPDRARRHRGTPPPSPQHALAQSAATPRFHSCWTDLLAMVDLAPPRMRPRSGSTRKRARRYAPKLATGSARPPIAPARATHDPDGLQQSIGSTQAGLSRNRAAAAARWRSLPCSSSGSSHRAVRHSIGPGTPYRDLPAGRRLFRMPDFLDSRTRSRPPPMPKPICRGSSAFAGVARSRTARAAAPRRQRGLSRAGLVARPDARPAAQAARGPGRRAAAWSSRWSGAPRPRASRATGRAAPRGSSRAEVYPALDRQIALMKRLRRHDPAGRRRCGALPRGDEIYAAALGPGDDHRRSRPTRSTRSA